LSILSTLRRPARSGWGACAAILYFLGAAIPFWLAVRVLDSDASSDSLRETILAFVIIGVLFGGLAQLLRASAHGAKTSWGKKVDGLGKLMGVFGWSLGLLGGVAFAMEGSTIGPWVIGLAIAAAIFPPIVVGFISLWNPKPKAGSDPELELQLEMKSGSELELELGSGSELELRLESGSVVKLKMKSGPGVRLKVEAGAGVEVKLKAGSGLDL
jgi:hypothetical protein